LTEPPEGRRPQLTRRQSMPPHCARPFGRLDGCGRAGWGRAHL